MCNGVHLANRELYMAFLRLIVAFEFLPPADPADRPIIDCLECNARPSSLTMDPIPFKITVRARDPAVLGRWIAESEARTAAA
jgi:phenylacetate 2-hydroxylase